MITLRTSLCCHHSTKKSKASERMQGKENFPSKKGGKRNTITRNTPCWMLSPAVYYFDFVYNPFWASTQVSLYLSGTKKCHPGKGEVHVSKSARAHLQPSIRKVFLVVPERTASTVENQPPLVNLLFSY
jgi:hypothetical protein